jgi:MoaA/NifB/PqqE/SkfB family radical SAM enzyme
MKVVAPNVAKLVRHENICLGNLSPVTAQIDLTNSCNLKCSFCQVHKKRDRKTHIDFDLMQHMLEELKSIGGCKGIQYTGGGEPTVHPRFEDIVRITNSLGFKIGMTTNGVNIKNLPMELLSMFEWVRVSLNSSRQMYKEIHGVNRYDDVMKGLIILDKIPNLTYGVSYIYSDSPESDVETLTLDLNNNLNDINYLRIGRDMYKPIPDKVVRNSILSTAKNVLKVPGSYVVFQVDRDTWVPKKCVMYKIKPRIDVFGSVYPCCVAHYRCFNKIGTFNEYISKIKLGDGLDIDVGKCPYCVYGSVNDFALMLENSEVINPDFI